MRNLSLLLILFAQSAFAAAPVWKKLPPPLIVIADGTADVRGEFAPAEGAAAPSGWRVQVAKDDKFHELVYDQLVGAGQSRLAPPGLPAGMWYTRVGAVGERGVVEEFSPVAPVQVSAPMITPDDRPNRSRINPLGLWCGVAGDPLTLNNFVVDRRRAQKVRCAFDPGSENLAELVLPPLPMAYRYEPRLEYVEPRAGYARVSFMVYDLSGDAATGRKLTVSGSGDVVVKDILEIDYPGMYEGLVHWKPCAKSITMTMTVEGAVESKTATVAVPACSIEHVPYSALH